jgi:hypothetical protein
VRWTITVEAQEFHHGEWREELSPRYSWSTGEALQPWPLNYASLLGPREMDWKWRTVGALGEGQRRVRVAIKEGVTGREA